MSAPHDSASGGSRARDPRHVGEVLARLAGELGVTNPTATSDLLQGWPEIVGSEIAEHARPARLRDGVLTVEVDAPEWATHLRYLAADVVRRVGEAVGDHVVEEVRLVVRPPTKRSGEPRARGRE